MKKLLISLGLVLGVGLSLPTNYLESRALLVPPTDYDLSYTFNSGTPWLIKDSSGVPDSFVPTAVRYLDSGYYTYTLDMNREYSGGGTTTVGLTSWSLPMSIQFTRSNTSWFNWSGSGDYAPTSAAVGSTVSSVFVKLIIQATNTSDNAYMLIMDNDTQLTRTYDVFLNGLNISQQGYSIGGSYLSYFYIPPQSTYRIESRATSSSIYLDGLYLKDLGLPNQDIITDAQEDGYVDGYSDGEDYGYDVGFEDGYNDGFTDAGGTTGVPQVVSLFRGLFGSIASVFAIEILPSITIGTLALFPILGVVFLFFKKVVQ